VTVSKNGDLDAGMLAGVDPELLSREELVDLVRDLQTALSGRSRPKRTAATGRSAPVAAEVRGADFTIVFDGGSLGNPGLGYGSYEIAGRGDVSAAQRIEFGQGLTNNQAEFHALIAALEELLRRTGSEARSLRIAVRGDSQLVIRGLTGEWKVKHPGLQPLHRQALELLRRFGSVDIAWHPRRESVKTFGH
jgi:ribonuclease HI